MHILNVYCKRVFKKKSSHILMCGFQNSNIDICKNKPQKYATKIPTTKQKGIHTSPILCLKTYMHMLQNF